MATFKGKNSTESVRKLAGARVRYNQQAFNKDDKQVVNFNFAEKTLYGRVDRTLTPVVANMDYIVPLRVQGGDGPTILLMDFVASQFADFVNKFTNAVRMHLLPGDDPIFTNIQAKRGFKNPVVLYDNYSDNIMGLYANNYLKKYSKDVNNFDDYLYFLPEFMEIMRDTFPVTFSGFQRSSQSSIFTSGLAIDIAGVPFGDDGSKQNLILNSPCFSFYLNLAKQYGFSVNKRNPGVLISDLQSPATTPYRKKFALSSINQIFASQYTKTLYQDLPLLQSLLVKGYNSFIGNNRIKRTIIPCGDGIRSQVTVREYISKDNINEVYYNNIIKTYIKVRNIEERKPFTNAIINQIISLALQYRKRSEVRMLDYIDNQFKSEYKIKNGSLTYYKKKLEKKFDK